MFRANYKLERVQADLRTYVPTISNPVHPLAPCNIYPPSQRSTCIYTKEPTPWYLRVNKSKVDPAIIPSKLSFLLILVTSLLSSDIVNYSIFQISIHLNTSLAFCTFTFYTKVTSTLDRLSLITSTHLRPPSLPFSTLDFKPLLTIPCLLTHSPVIQSDLFKTQIKSCHLPF